jgi:two-component system cell cycle sensor histidine kinase/response regulator CckA
MSTALLKFQPSKGSPPQAAIFAAALDACPQALAIAEDGKVIYRNHSFAESSGSADELPRPNFRADSDWQETSFAVDGHSFQLLTLRPSVPVSDSQHLALIGRLVGGVAHDFNNLLTGILLYCDLMQGKLAPSDPLGQKVDEIRVAAEQGAGLIRQLMSVGREDRDAPRSVAFNDALREMAPLLRHLVGEKVHITMELGEGTGCVSISLAQAQQIVLNLALNARDAMPGGGEVRLKTNSRKFEGTGHGDRILELTVKDCGTGMDTQTASRIFDAFFTTKGPGRGTGMGLTTVRKIVEDAGGVITVGTAPGQGTQITVRLPEIHADNPQATLPPDEKNDAIRGAAL